MPAEEAQTLARLLSEGLVPACASWARRRRVRICGRGCYSGRARWNCQHATSPLRHLHPPLPLSCGRRWSGCRGVSRRCHLHCGRRSMGPYHRCGSPHPRPLQTSWRHWRPSGGARGSLHDPTSWRAGTWSWSRTSSRSLLTLRPHPPPLHPRCTRHGQQRPVLLWVPLSPGWPAPSPVFAAAAAEEASRPASRPASRRAFPQASRRASRPALCRRRSVDRCRRSSAAALHPAAS